MTNKKLWKLIFDKNMKKHDLYFAAKLNSTSICKLFEDENVNSNIHLKIFKAIVCNESDNIGIKHDRKNDEKEPHYV